MTAEYEQLAKSYITELEKNVRAGNATESTHRPALKTFIQGLANGITATNEPKHVECGAPDYVISRNTKHGPLTVGHIETKDIDAALQAIESDSKRAQPKTAEGRQIKRYREGLPNLVLTDYLEFRWYVEGELRLTARLANQGTGGRLSLSKDGAQDIESLLVAFLEHAPEPVTKPKELAVRMARLTHFIRDIIVEAAEKDHLSITLRDLHTAFKETLIPELEPQEFADMFAQTLAYGLFAARADHDESRGRFQRLGAAAEIPKTNPFLRRLFAIMTGPDLDDEPFAGFADDLTQLLADTDMAAVLADFGKRARKEDPIIHFYETFLAAYDPALRKKRGVYYTPEPVVSYIVGAVDDLLKSGFDCPRGLADTETTTYTRTDEHGGVTEETGPRVLILDPMCGTGTFLYAIVDQIRQMFEQEGNAGMWAGYVHGHLLPRLFGFEIQMAPYAVAHLKLGMQLAAKDMNEAQREKWAYDFSGDERLGVYLTNTLEEAIQRSQALPFAGWIAEEANAAAEVKRHLPVMVVIGNPPYSPSDFEGPWIMELLEMYKRDLDETKTDLNREEWKFLRFAQWRIEETGAGIVGLVINNSFLDAVTHRQMRRSLLETFDEVYVVNLHGSVMAGRATPAGVNDENVFDIQQGVTIAILVNFPVGRRNAGRAEAAKVRYAEVWGSREEKQDWLKDNEIASTEWTDLTPREPYFLFVPSSGSSDQEYDRGFSLKDLFVEYSSGIQTKKDRLTIQFNRAAMTKTLARFAELDPEAAREEFDLGDDGRDWQVEAAQRDVEKSRLTGGRLVQILYRPFDVRWTYYTGKSRGFLGYPRRQVMQHVIGHENLCLISMRQTVGGPYSYAGVTRHPNCHGTFYLGNKGQDYLMPLYVYPADEPQAEATVLTSPWPAGKAGRRPNLSPEFVANLEQHLGLTFIPDGWGDLAATFGPVDLFHYIYAILHSPTYRERYAEFLKIDFPRVPLTSDVDIFRTLVAKGAELVGLHLMESPALAKSITHYPVSGPDTVEARHPRYRAPGEPEPGTGKPLKEGRVYISKDDSKTGKEGQYFGGVPQEVWEFHVGGYQVCEKWLKDRRGRTLNHDDKTHYDKIVVALKETIRLMEEIDAAIPSWPIE